MLKRANLWLEIAELILPEMLKWRRRVAVHRSTTISDGNPNHTSVKTINPAQLRSKPVSIFEVHLHWAFCSQLDFNDTA